MKRPGPKSNGKRSRTATIEDDDAHSDDDIRVDDVNSRPAQAERKRELERNRRNLVNVRFLELEAEICRCAPRVESPATSAKNEPGTKCRRIDKEAVLKEAAQRLAVQRKEITSSAERLTNMSSEIDNLRAEKVELRSDKTYLREELDTVRLDVQRLRSDNIQLWQALQKQNSIKNVLAPDVAKIPADLFMRPKHEQAPLVSVSGAGLMANGATIPVAPPQHPTAFDSPSVPTNPPAPQQGQQNDPNNPARVVSGGDSFLVFQSPEELGELFTSYIPGSATAFERVVSGIPTNVSMQRQAGTETASNVLSQGLSALGSVQANQVGYEFDPRQQHPNLDTKPPDTGPTRSSHSNDDNDKQDEDPFSDIACCV